MSGPGGLVSRTIRLGKAIQQSDSMMGLLIDRLERLGQLAVEGKRKLHAGALEIPPEQIVNIDVI